MVLKRPYGVEMLLIHRVPAVDIWSELPIDSDSLPVDEAWQCQSSFYGKEHLINRRPCRSTEILDAIPWDAIDATDHAVDVDFTELLSGGSRSGL